MAATGKKTAKVSEASNGGPSIGPETNAGQEGAGTDEQKELDKEFRDLFFNKGTVIAEKYSPPRLHRNFHYTNAAGLIGVVSGNCLWFSDTKFMNDGSERLWALQVYKQVIEEIKPSLDHEKKRKFVDRMYEHEEAFSESFRAVVFCMSSDGNLLNQWRDYGKDIVPYCIEFDTITLRSDAPAGFGTNLHQLIYDGNVQRRVLKEGLEEILKIASLAWSRSDAELDRLAMWASFEMSDLLRRLKHPAFEAERESRLSTSNYQLRQTARKYRTGPLGVVPYYEYRPETKLPILSVRVGPSPYAAASVAAAEMLLRDHGFDDVPVLESNIPIRR